MATKTVTTCDVCGVTKGEVNHWYTARITGDGGIKITSFYLSVEPSTQYLCGEDCLHKWLSNNLKSLNTNESEQPKVNLCEKPR